jgi:raffinose/stachyose/melibiose transport system substrate-binding protein
MKKVLLYLLMGTVLAAGLFAGGEKDSNSSTQKKRTKITVLMRSSGNDETYRIWHTLFEEFAAKKGLKVEYELVPSDADYVNKLQLYISSNQLPDFYGCPNGVLSKAAKNSGALLNVEDELKKMGKFDLLNKAVVDFLTDKDDNTMYLFPQALYCEFFFYRKDIFQKYNINVPKTWDDFLADCEVLKNNGEIPVIIAGAANWQLLRYLSFIPWRVTHDKFIYGYMNGTDSFSQNKIAQAGVHLLATMGTQGNFQKGFTSTDFTAAVNLFFGGTGAIFYEGSGSIASASKLYSEGKLGVFPVPALSGVKNMDTNVPLHAGFGNAFNAKTYDATMKEFLEYAVDNYSKVCYASGVFSPFTGEPPANLDPLFYVVYPLFKNAKQSWVSWDDKLDSATLTSMVDADQELALGMISENQYITEMDNVIKNNRK